MFSGSNDEALKIARLDDDQYVIDCIAGYSGDPEKRSTLQFLVRYEDGDELFVKYSPDITMTKAFEEFCKVRRHLSILLFPLEEVRSLKHNIIAQDVNLLCVCCYLPYVTYGKL